MDSNPEGYRPHNIFDMNLPSSHPGHHAHHPPQPQPPPPHSQQQYNPGSPFAINDGYGGPAGGGPHNPTFNFNSTIPALSNRYADPDFTFSASHQAPSPDGLSRSRSHSRDGWSSIDNNRPPSSGGMSSASSTTSGPIAGPPSTAGGPVRRSRHRNSFSSTSPPPTAFRRNPGAIAIPRNSSVGHGGVGGTPISPIGMHSMNNGQPGSASSESFGFGPGTPQDMMHPFHMGPPPTSSSPPEHHQGFNAYHPLPPLHEHHHQHMGYHKSSSPPHHGFHNMPTSYSYGSSTTSMSYQPTPGSGGGFGISTSHPSPPLSTSVPTSTGTSVSVSGKTKKAKEKEDKATILATEKKRRRRESHNAVERRRRDNINEKISELATLIPESMLDGSMESNASPTTIAEEPSSPSTSQPPIQQALAHNADLGTAGEAQSAGLLNTFGLGSLDALPPDSPISPIIPSSVVASTTNNAPSPTSGGGNASGGAGGAEGQVVKANKGMILRKSVDYIRYLQQLVSVQGARNRELEAELRAAKGQGGGGVSSGGGGGGSFAMSGTMGLGFGMGMGMMTFQPQQQQHSSSTPRQDDVGVNSQTSTLKPNDVKMSSSVGGEEGLSPLTGSEDGSEGVKMEEEASIGDQVGIERGRRRERDAMES
ncbi:helix-loop-helix DNA-binding domain-containing protein [Flagelloscypha sp. PMI_526]|nr:helix-loop-helix DNA-binding domain-containing protein [Flagelloscypha sp. PMI_526]